MTSLPVPLSPVIKTPASLGATRSTVRTISCMTALRKIGAALPLIVESARRSALFSSFCCRFSIARLIVTRSTCVSNGLLMK